MLFLLLLKMVRNIFNPHDSGIDSNWVQAFNKNEIKIIKE
jgi:hypothetical protein